MWQPVEVMAKAAVDALKEEGPADKRPEGEFGLERVWAIRGEGNPQDSRDRQSSDGRLKG